MISACIKAWVWAGIDNNDRDNISPERLTNMIALLLMLVPVLHMPVHVAYWAQGGLWQIGNLLLHTVLCPFIPLANAKHRPGLAKVLLLLLFASLITTSSLYLGYSSANHFFLVLGIFICPFLFHSHQSSQLWLAIAGYLILFLSLEHLKIDHLGIAPGPYMSLCRQTAGLGLVVTTLLCAYHIHRDHSASWQRVDKERNRSESLLLQVLPKPIAEKLKSSRQPVADYFSSATTIFADIAGFSRFTREHTPMELVTYLNQIFTAFDKLAKRYGLEKIKTIGDQYMAVSGVPESCPDHAARCCCCALEMQRAFSRINHQFHFHNGLRIGINSGEVVAGVIGQEKYSYDLWGDSVNLASRMESQGQSQRIQVSEYTYKLCQHRFIFKPRGNLAVRGIGTVPAYWLLGERPQQKQRMLSQS
ncbi:adenylate/guanylate cyclase domain-containing protein [Aliiglaciecola sp. CAU 1673]|uniref:adenylate/guanylate cyclase domain-containing protein n=1 Tax=Aliiglaciecola sp. CAU 1673 TaxID=3032595 RepID=UPI0023D9A069|nr:adenylate/guanylate cyclase domain-containing protein [Aliiglaciecola sp. CAU 1673]MDF2177724.1 adenylate/guanylate cyclase domain-containing protein [Aliiglaciecola sp. CAU 1673]